jgi:hypothetical protein
MSDTAGCVARRNAREVLVIDEWDMRVDQGTHLKLFDGDAALCGYQWAGDWASSWYDPARDWALTDLCEACLAALEGE